MGLHGWMILSNLHRQMGPMNGVWASGLARGFPMLWYSLRVNPAPLTWNVRPVSPWRPQLETGLEPVDTQHRQLVEALAHLTGALTAPGAESGLAVELADLARNLIRHCQTEETLMREAGFPERIAHSNQHQELLHQVRDLQYRHAKGQPLSREALDGIAGWLDQHIQESDRPMAGYLKRLHAV